MPKIPVLPQAGAAGSDDLSGLSPEQAAGVRRLEARDAQLERGLAVASAWRAGHEALRDTEDAPDAAGPGFARSFLSAFDRERADALKAASPALRVDLDQDLLGLRAELSDRAVAAEASDQALRRRLGLRRALDNYRAGVARDPGAFDSATNRMMGLVESIGLSEAQREALRVHSRDVLANAAVDGMLDDPTETEAALTGGLFDDALTPASKAARLAEVRVRLDRERLLSRERARGALLALAGEGRAEEAAIAAAEAAGSLTPADATRVRAADAEARQAAETKRMRIDRVAAATGPLDPDLPEDQAAVDAYWETVSEAYASDDPAQQQAAHLTFVKTKGVLPTALANRYRRGLLSGDPALVVQEAGAIAELDRTDARLISALPTDEVRLARAIDEFAALDLPPDRAVELGEQKAAAEIGDMAADDPASATASDDEIVDNDQTDTPFLGSDEGVGDPADEPESLSDEEVDALLRRDGIAPIPRGDTPSEDETETKTAPLSKFVAVQRNELLAARQRTSPDTQRYERLGRYLETDAGAGFVDENGEFVRADASRHVILIDPQRGEFAVYRRSEETNEGRFLSLGRLLSASLFTNPFTVAARTAQIAGKGASGASTTLASGIGPTGGGGRRAGKGARAARQSGPRRTPGPERRGDFGPGRDGEIAWREFLDRKRSGLPMGFKDLDEVRNLLNAAEAEFRTAGFPRARLAIRGNAATNRSFDETTGRHTGHRFDAGTKSSDFDFAIVDPRLHARAVELGIEDLGNLTRTGPLNPKDLDRLGLGRLTDAAKNIVGDRPYSFVIYNSEKALVERGPFMWLSKQE